MRLAITRLLEGGRDVPVAMRDKGPVGEETGTGCVKVVEPGSERWK